MSLLINQIEGKHHGYTPAVAKHRMSSEAQTPLWRTRIAAAVAPHGRLKELASAAGMKSPQLQKIANGTTRDPGVTTLSRIAEAMGMTLAALINETHPRIDEGRVPFRPGDQGAAVLEEVLRSLDTEEPAEETWRGDVLKAIAALTRALRRTDAQSGPAAVRRPAAPLGRRTDSGR